MTRARMRTEMPAAEYVEWQVYFGRVRQRKQIAEAQARAGMT